MRIENSEIVMDKEEFLINTLLTGIACQLIATNSSQTLDYWMQYLSDKADEQFKQMTPKQREDMINAYVRMSENL
ncbi:hypothetical protein NIES4075_72990 [Tolypothrix sp. NIES-4075]|uniref:hypothetical protein n=1 Tax=Tolypothrix sp. NIES-4075 TaxID=2005459 RepID=UPI000B5C8E5C|nr:hypothetical protein [Tolypothrix sp. NIES-4075]GAX46278.1 hypothetical protein NIES4075_72990 [Tolypothrix sp. NIES-4075]